MQIPFLTRARTLYRSRQDPECVHTLADGAWRVLLIGVATVAVGTVAYGGWMLWSGLGYEPGTIDGVQADALSRTALQEAIETLEQRALDYQTLRTQAPSVVDPGL